MYIKYFFYKLLLFIFLFVKFCNMKIDKYLVFLWLICILGLIFFVGHFSGILIDFGREVYYPEQMLNGKVLYKDLFNIYGPFAYQINAILYKIFGTKLSALYGAGIVCSLLTVSGIYLIAKKFLSGFSSFSIGIFSIVIGVTTTSIFNFHFPYSWAMLYGLVAFLYSLLFLIKFQEDNKVKNLYFSSFLAGICITCKYDFLLYTLVILFFIFKNKNFKALITFFIVPILSYGILFVQGMRFLDIFNTLQIVNTMAHTKTLTYFYQNSGVYFTSKSILWNVFQFFVFAVIFGLFLFGWNLFKKENYFSKILSIILCITALMISFVIYTTAIKTSLSFIPLAMLVLAICLCKKSNMRLTILVISSFCVSIKVFWALMLGSYGTYYAPIILIAIFALLRLLSKNYDKAISIYLLFFSFIYFSYNCYGLDLSQQTIETPNGKIITSANLAKSSSELIDYISKNTKPSEKIVIFPEGMMINFLTDRKSDDWYNSLLPLYIETFGEEKIIEHFNSDKPDYIILNNLDMKDYYYRYICQDYALGFCEFVKDNYRQETVINNGYLNYIVFKKQ